VKYRHVLLLIITLSTFAALGMFAQNALRQEYKPIKQDERSLLKKSIFAYMSMVNTRNAEILDVSDDLCVSFSYNDFSELGKGSYRFGRVVLGEGSRRGEAGDEIWSYNKRPDLFSSVEFTATVNKNTGHCSAYVRSVPMTP
jgi:hypothetical protein